MTPALLSQTLKRLVPLAGILGAATVAVSGASLRFYGHRVSAPDVDRVEIPLQTHRPVDVGASLTVEFWLKAAASNTLGAATLANDGCITGNIILDGDVYGDGDYGDGGISLSGGRIAFGINNVTAGQTIVGKTVAADSAWHHIAVTRNATTSQLRVFVDGVLDSQGYGPLGDLSYRHGRATAWPNSDPFLVLGAEKHDAGAEYPRDNGWLDEPRVSTVVRYTNSFARPAAAFAPDADTAALYHFDEGTGDVIGDSAIRSSSPGVWRFGGSGVPGREWSAETPFATLLPELTVLATTLNRVVSAWTPAFGTHWGLHERLSLTPGAWTNALAARPIPLSSRPRCRRSFTACSNPETAGGFYESEHEPQPHKP
jgi:hypothetical protein